MQSPMLDPRENNRILEESLRGLWSHRNVTAPTFGIALWPFWLTRLIFGDAELCCLFCCCFLYCEVVLS